MKNHRILTIAHGHPDLSVGGAEIAAYQLFQAYRSQPQVEEAWFVGRIQRENPSGIISLYRPREYLWEQSMGDWFLLKSANRRALCQSFRQFLHALRPTVVHIHHYSHLGLEMLRLVKEEIPGIKLILTLHEYMAICHQQGQMVKKNSLELCTQESLEACHRCFPAFSQEQFWLRKQFIQEHFAAVDRFVSPSHFLRTRYIEWGLPPERIGVIENGQADLPPLPPRELKPQGKRNRFGFFGQMTQFKGVDLLLEALARIPKEIRQNLLVEIHGANLERQTDAFREKIGKLLDPLVEEGIVRFVGPYRLEQLRHRMKDIDWVIVPSIWWENSPMIIQESFVHGRPVICSDIGGMAEKVTHGVNGLHFSARNPIDLGDTLLKARDEEGLWDTLHLGIPRPLTHEACAEVHLELFNK